MELSEFYNEQAQELDRASIKIARISNESGTVIRYSVSVGQERADGSTNHIQFDMSEAEFIHFADKMDKEIHTDEQKAYQTNIINLLERVEKKIKWEEATFENHVCSAPNSYASGYHAGVVNTLNNIFITLQELQLKSFHEKVLGGDQIDELLNESA